MKSLSLSEAEYIAHQLAKELFEFDEPLPDFRTRYPGRLESCLAQPFQHFDGKPLYRTLSQRAALLFYLVIKNHPFENGNKRMALTLMLVFMYKNGLWIEMEPEELYKIACEVAQSEPKRKDAILLLLTTLIKDFQTEVE